MTSSIVRKWLRKLRVELATPGLDISTLHSLLAAPLVWLQLDDTSNLITTTPPPESLSSTTTTRTLLIEAGFPEHTRFLLRNVCVNWLPAFTKEQRHKYFDAYFIPTLQQDTQYSTETQLLNSHIYANSLRVLTGSLSEGWATQDQFILQTILRLLTELLQKLPILYLYQSQLTCTPTKASPKETAAWHDITSILCSIPTRVANALAGELPSALLDSTLYFQNLIQKIFNAIKVQFNTDGVVNDGAFLKSMSQLVERCIRLGHGAAIVPIIMKTHQQTSYPIWPRLVEQMATSQKSQVLRIIIQNTMQSNEDAYLFNRDLLNALLLPKDAVPSHEWTAAQQESFVYTLRQTLLSIQWKAYVLHSFVKHIASVPCQHNTKVDIQSQLLNQIISYWGDLMFIQSANQFKQLNVTHAIFVMIKYFAPKIVENIAHTSVFLDGVNRRLDSTVSLYRKIGMITAESFSNIASPTDSKLNFELDKDDPEVVTVRNLSHTPEIPEHCYTANTNVKPDENALNQSYILNGDLSYNEDTLDDPDAIIQSIDAISEEEEEEEEEKEEKDDVSGKDWTSALLSVTKSIDIEENGAWKTKKPKYLRDLIQYLSCEDDVDKWMVGIIAAAELIHIVHNQDLAVWVIPLTRRLVYLQDVYEQPEFIPCLCAALTVLMEKSEVATEQIIDFIGNRDCSLSRRVLLLECLRQTTHRLNQLPTSTDKKSKISKPSGTVVWTSMRLSLQSPQHGTTQWMQRHSTVIHHLLNLSVNADNRHLMLQDTLVLRPYIATLSDMISLSKNAPDIWPLCNTLLELLMPLRYHPNAEILEVVLIGLISVVSALNANVHTDFLSFIRPIHDWLAGVFEAPIAAQLQPQIVALGSALSAFAEKAETNIYTMLDRMEV